MFFCKPPSCSPLTCYSRLTPEINEACWQSQAPAHSSALSSTVLLLTVNLNKIFPRHCAVIRRNRKTGCQFLFTSKTLAHLPSYKVTHAANYIFRSNTLLSSCVVFPLTPSPGITPPSFLFPCSSSPEKLLILHRTCTHFTLVICGQYTLSDVTRAAGLSVPLCNALCWIARDSLCVGGAGVTSKSVLQKRGSRMVPGIPQTPTWAWSPRLKCCQCSADTHKRVFVCQSSALSGPVALADNMSTPECKDSLQAAPQHTGEHLIWSFGRICWHNDEK